MAAPRKKRTKAPPRPTLTQQITKWGGIASGLMAIAAVSYYVLTYSVEYVGGPDAPYAPKKEVVTYGETQDRVLKFLSVESSTIIDLKKKDCIRDKADAISELQRNPTSKGAEQDLLTANDCLDTTNKLSVRIKP